MGRVEQLLYKILIVRKTFILAYVLHNYTFRIEVDNDRRIFILFYYNNVIESPIK